MAEIRTLKNPPIKESLFDIRAKVNPDFDVNLFTSLQEELSDIFPKMKKRKSSNIQFSFHPQAEPETETTAPVLIGYFFESNDGKLIAQFRNDGFTLNRLQPYSSWDDIFPLALELWEKYKMVAEPEAIPRIALRYINQFVIQHEDFIIEDYLNVSPQIPESLSQTVSTFQSRVTIISDDELSAAHITQSLGKNPQGAGALIQVDIDAFRNLQETGKEMDLKEVFIKLRELKNMIFFNYLTEKTLEMFE